MDCPQCHFANPAGAARCAKCEARLEGAQGATILEPVESVTADRLAAEAGATILEPVESVTAAGTGSEATAWSSPAEASSSGGPAAVGPGTVLADRYEILQSLGEGGMGAVYKARDRELDRIVALKVIRPDLARHAEILQRFKRELVLSRQVTHRNVIRIFDLGVVGGLKFITMEYVEGRDLKSMLGREQLTPAQAVDLMCQICRGLEAAHAVGVIHRDLKPQNIMLDEQGRAVVMDFGLAHSMEDRGMTQTGALMGTPDYMSPEQAKGEKADARSDVFSVGIIFYEMLTGRLPFQGDSLLATLLARTQGRAKPVREVNPETPQVVSDIVAKCLATDAAQRYQTTSELLADLETWQSGAKGQTIRVPKGPVLRMVAPSVAWKWIALSIAAMAILLTPVAWYLFHSSGKQPAAPPLSLGILPFRNVKGDPSLDWMGPEMAAMLRTNVGQSSRLRTVSSGRVTQILHDLQIAPDSNIDPETLKRIGDSISADRMLWGQFAKFGDQIQIDATLQDLKQPRSFPLKAVAPNEKELPRAIEQLARDVQKSLALPSDAIKELQAKVLKPSTQAVQALRYYNEGLQLAHQRKNPDALKSFQASVKEDPNFALAYAKMGQVYANLGYSTEAEQSARKAVDLSEKLPPQERYLIAAIHAQSVNDNQKAVEEYEKLAQIVPEDAEVQLALAGLYNAVGSFAKARESYGRLLARDQKDVEALSGVAGVEISAGNPQAAVEHLNRALPITIQLENDPQKSAVLYELGMAYAQMGKREEALRNYQQALEIQRRLGERSLVARTLNGMGQVQDALGRAKEALNSFQEALRLRQDLGDKTGLGDTLIDLSNYYEARGEYDDALSMLKRSLQIQREVGNQFYEALCLNNIGANYADKGQFDDALTYYNQALSLREKLKDSLGIADSNYGVAEALVKLGQYDQALTRYLSALELYRSANDKRLAAFASYGLGKIFEQQGRLGASLNAKAEALKTIREIQDRIGLAELLGGYGDSLNLLGRFADSRKAVDEALTVAREAKNQTLIGQNLGFDGDNFFYQGDSKGARARYEQASQVAAKTTDRRLMLIAKFNLAKVAVQEGHPREAAGTLRKLADDADGQGLKYLSVECSIYLGEALVEAKDYPHASQELERALARSEKLGLLTLQARSHYLLANALRLGGNATEASRHYAGALRILDELKKEAKSDTLLKRADLSAIFAESKKWSESPPA